MGAYCMAYRLVSNDNRRYKLLPLETYLVLWLSANNIFVTRIFAECGTVYHPIVIFSVEQHQLETSKLRSCAPDVWASGMFLNGIIVQTGVNVSCQTVGT